MTARGLKPYPAYKPSGIPWLGDLPEHWGMSNLRYLVDIKTGSKDTENKEEDGAYPFFVRSNTVERISTYTYDGEAVLTAGDGVGVGKVYHYYSGKFDYHQRVYAFVNFRKIIGKYFYYVFSAFFEFQMTQYSAKSTVDSVRRPFLQSFVVPIPFRGEQTSIVDYIESKSAKIDALIKKKEALLRLLGEKRAAIITHAVTKGLNPKSPLKPSDIPWLGDVPIKWAVVHFSHYISFQEGPGIMASDFEESGVPLIRISGVKGKWVSLEGCDYLSPEKVQSKWSHFKLNEGDLLISCSASTGGISRVSKETVGAIPYTGLIRLYPRSDKILSGYIEWLVQSDVYNEQISLLKTGSTMQHYGPAHLRQIKIVLPSVEEQQKISEYLEQKTVGMDAVKTKIEEAIGRLKEYRLALITGAVTGKIKVS